MPTAQRGSVWGRVIAESWADVSAVEAGKLLALRFSKADRLRMRQLGERSNAGTLTLVERAELEELVSVGPVIAILHSLARQHVGAEPTPAATEARPAPPRRQRQAS